MSGTHMMGNGTRVVTTKVVYSIRYPIDHIYSANEDSPAGCKLTIKFHMMYRSKMYS